MACPICKNGIHECNKGYDNEMGHFCIHCGVGFPEKVAES